MTQAIDGISGIQATVGKRGREASAEDAARGAAGVPVPAAGFDAALLALLEPKPAPAAAKPAQGPRPDEEPVFESGAAEQASRALTHAARVELDDRAAAELRTRSERAATEKAAEAADEEPAFESEPRPAVRERAAAEPRRSAEEAPRGLAGATRTRGEPAAPAGPGVQTPEGPAAPRGGEGGGGAQPEARQASPGVVAGAARPASPAAATGAGAGTGGARVQAVGEASGAGGGRREPGAVLRALVDRGAVQRASIDAKSAPSARPLRAAWQAVEPQVVNGLARVLSRGEGEMTLRLSPEHLGRLEIRVRVRQGEVGAQVLPENERAHALLTENLHTLRSALEARGLEVQRLEVLRPQEASPQGDPGQNADGQGGPGPDSGSGGAEGNPHGDERGREGTARSARFGAAEAADGGEGAGGAGGSGFGWDGAAGTPARPAVSELGGWVRVDAVA